MSTRQRAGEVMGQRVHTCAVSDVQIQYGQAAGKSVAQKLSKLLEVLRPQ